MAASPSAIVAALLGAGATSAQQLIFGYIPASLESPDNVSTAERFEEAAAWKSKAMRLMIC